MDFLTDIINALKGNQLLAGGLTLGIVGGAIAMLRNAPKHVLAFLKDRFSVSVEIRDEQVFDAFAEWLAVQRYGSRCRRIAAAMDRRPHAPRNERSEPQLVFSPGRGHHIFRHDGKFFWLERARDEGGTEIDKLFAREYMVLRSWGTSPVSSRRMLQAAAEYAREKRRGKSVVYVREGYDSWGVAAMDDGRPIESVILRDGLLEEIVRDAEQFFADRETYQRLGIPYRRGYLLHGPHGCGKSSLIGALAAHLSAPMYVLPLSSPRMDDDMLLGMMRNTLPGSIILVEDVDAAFKKREAGDAAASNVTFKGLINAIDGVASQQGRVYFFTTNHLDRLDPALIRPGRVDMQREVSYCDHSQLRRMFLRFFPDYTELANGFADKYQDGSVAPCVIQQHLMLHRNNAYRALWEAIASAPVHVNGHSNGVTA